MSSTAIEAALLSRAQAFAASQSLTISLPGKLFTPPTPVTLTSRWLRALFFPAPTETLHIVSNEGEHFGFMQVDVFNGLGVIETGPSTIADALMAFFPYNKRLAGYGIVVEISGKPFRGPAIRDDSWLMIPVRIPYRCFAD